MEKLDKQFEDILNAIGKINGKQREIHGQRKDHKEVL